MRCVVGIQERRPIHVFMFESADNYGLCVRIFYVCLQRTCVTCNRLRVQVTAFRGKLENKFIEKMATARVVIE